MLISMKEVLKIANENEFAVGAFNCTESSLFRAVVETAEKLQSPAIIQVSPGEFNFATADFYEYVSKRCQNSKVPFALHLDHGKSISDCIKAIKAGFTSVMIDGSELPYEENVSLTKTVVEIAHAVDVTVEGELGTIGSIGNSDEGGVENITYTNPDEVIDFYNRTGVDCLAIAIGTAHGIYPKGFEPKLQLELLKEIRKKSPIPLVLHGGSDNKDEEIRKACEIGISKVNISSDMKYVFFKKLKEVLDSNGGFIPAKVLEPAIEEAKKIVEEKMLLFGSENKAYLYGGKNG